MIATCIPKMSPIAKICHQNQWRLKSKMDGHQSKWIVRGDSPWAIGVYRRND